MEAEFGEIILVLDEVFSESHKFKFMGIRIESKKTVTVLGALADVNLTTNKDCYRKPSTDDPRNRKSQI